jgi:hypothetical protein
MAISRQLTVLAGALSVSAVLPGCAAYRPWDAQITTTLQAPGVRRIVYTIGLECTGW